MKRLQPKDIFSAALNLQLADVDEATREKSQKLISHSWKTALFLVLWAIVAFGVSVYLDNFNDIIYSEFEEVNRPRSISGYFWFIMFVSLYARYSNLHTQTVDVIKNLKTRRGEPEHGADTVQRTVFMPETQGRDSSR